MATPNQLTIYAPDYVGEQQTGSQDSQLHATAQHSHSNIAGLSGYAFSDSPQPYPSNPFGASYKSSQQFALMDLHPPVPYYRPTYEFPYDPSQGVGSVPKYVSSQSPLMLQSQPQLHQQQLQPPQLQQQQYQQSQQLYGHLLQSRYLLSSQRAFGDQPLTKVPPQKPLASTNDTVLSPEMLLEPKEELTKPKKPRIVTTYWEDEKTICYQVEVHGVLVSRRQDTDYINGTKLLNVAGMSRGKRDGMLKSEHNKYVVRVGAMKLKGVWIPFNRAAEIARNEGIDELLYPLFVKDIKAFYEERGSELKTWDPLELPPEVEKFDTKTQAI